MRCKVVSKHWRDFIERQDFPWRQEFAFYENYSVFRELKKVWTKLQMQDGSISFLIEELLPPTRILNHLEDLWGALIFDPDILIKTRILERCQRMSSVIDRNGLLFSRAMEIFQKFMTDKSRFKGLLAFIRIVIELENYTLLEKIFNALNFDFIYPWEWDDHPMDACKRLLYICQFKISRTGDLESYKRIARLSGQANPVCSDIGQTPIHGCKHRNIINYIIDEVSKSEDRYRIPKLLEYKYESQNIKLPFMSLLVTYGKIIPDVDPEQYKTMAMDSKPLKIKTLKRNPINVGKLKRQAVKMTKKSVLQVSNYDLELEIMKAKEGIFKLWQEIDENDEEAGKMLEQMATLNQLNLQIIAQCRVLLDKLR